MNPLGNIFDLLIGYILIHHYDHALSFSVGIVWLGMLLRSGSPTKNLKVDRP